MHDRRLTSPADATAAAWLIETEVPFDRLVMFGPEFFAAYARLRFIRDPRSPCEAEADVDLPDDHRSDLDQARRALRTLGRSTTTPDRCYFCVWDGWPDVTLITGWARAATFPLPSAAVQHRRYALLEGPLDAIESWEDHVGTAPPAYVWPADHTWCFASDVDPHWAGIGASRAALDPLLQDRELDVVLADPALPQPTFSS